MPILRGLISSQWCPRPPYRWSSFKSLWIARRRCHSSIRSYRILRYTQLLSKIKPSSKEWSFSVTTHKMKMNKFKYRSNRELKTLRILSLAKKSSSKLFLRGSRKISSASTWRSATQIGLSYPLTSLSSKESPFFWTTAAGNTAQIACMR